MIDPALILNQTVTSIREFQYIMALQIMFHIGIPSIIATYALALIPLNGASKPQGMEGADYSKMIIVVSVAVIWYFGALTLFL